MDDGTTEPEPGPVTHYPRMIPNAVITTHHSLRQLSRDAGAIYDSLPELNDRLVFLGQLQQLERKLGEIRAWVESRCAGAMPRSKVEDEDLGLVATRSAGWRPKWDSRELLHDLLYEREVKAAGGEVEDPAAFERWIWDLVDFVLEHGAYSPRTTPLKDRRWSDEDIDVYRKKQGTRRTVKVELGTEGTDDADAGAGPDDEPEAVDSPDRDQADDGQDPA